MRQALIEVEAVKQTGKSKPSDERGRRIKLAIALAAIAAAGVLLYNQFSGPALLPGQAVSMELTSTQATAATTPAGVPTAQSNPAATEQPTAGLPATSTSSNPPPPALLSRPAGPTMVVPNG